jgi:DNA-binding NarL/FixJ family response regulator
MKVLLVDDHGLFLEGLNNLLHAGGYTVVGAALNLARTRSNTTWAKSCSGCT